MKRLIDIIRSWLRSRRQSRALHEADRLTRVVAISVERASARRVL